MLTASGLTSGLAYLFNVHALKEWTVFKLEGVERKKRNEPEREGLPCCCASIGCPFSPDASASNAVAMGNQGAGSRPVHQRLRCTGWQLSSSPSLSLSLSLVALRQAPVHQSGDPRCERWACEEPARAGANSERAHQGAQVQVSGAHIPGSQQISK